MHWNIASIVEMNGVPTVKRVYACICCDNFSCSSNEECILGEEKL